MKSTIIIQRKHKEDIEGYLYCRYFNGSGKKKLVSLNFKMSVIHFDKYYNTEFNQFKKSVYKYEVLNTKIKELLSDDRAFEVKKTKELSLITFFSDYIKLQNNPATIFNYNSVLNKLEKYKLDRNKKDILFSDIDYYFAVDFKNYLLESITINSVRQYIKVLRTILNIARDEQLYSENYNYFNKLDLKPIYKNKKILSIEDIDTLFKLSYYHDFDNTIETPYFETRTMLLFSIFCSGIRISDMLLMRKKDLKENYIEIFTKKTSEYLRVPYNDILLTLLFQIFDYKDIKTSKYNSEYLKYEFFDYLKNVDDNDFIFSEFLSKAPILKDYDKSKEMTQEQYLGLNILRIKYNNNLKKLKEIYKLNIESISSHTGRYTWTNILLNIDGVNLVDISRSLSHKSISTTEAYIERNYGLDRMKNIGNLVSNNVFNINNNENNYYNKSDEVDDNQLSF